MTRAERLRELPADQLREHEAETAARLFRARMANGAGGLNDTSQLPKLRKEFARCKTIEWQRLQQEFGVPSRRGGQVVLAKQDDRRIAVLTARQLLELPSAPAHLNLASLDEVEPARLFRSHIWSTVLTLDATRLNAGDEFLEGLAASKELRRLWWLDLAGNRRISQTGVELLSQAVKAGRLAQLSWLNLVGTGCAATPYVDGMSWRIAGDARKLAKHYGYQRWMLLGSRNVEDAGREVLAPASRQLPPDRFMRA